MTNVRLLRDRQRALEDAEAARDDAIRLVHADGVSAERIARDLGMDKDAVQRVLDADA